MNFKPLLPHLIAVAAFFLVVVVMFSPQFQGKTLQMGDIRNYTGAAKESLDYAAATGERANWTGSSFGGMPTFQISSVQDGNQLVYVEKPLQGFLPRPAGYFFAGMLACYLLLILLGVSPWLSIAGAVGAAISTNNLVLFEAGHMTKLLVVLYLPLVAAGILVAFRRQYLLGGLLFALGMGLVIKANHHQMIYYFGLTLPFFGAARLWEDYRAGNLLHFGKATGVLVLGLLLAVGAGASNLMTTLEYAPSTMRGGQVLETPLDASGGEAAPQTGLEWEYAMQWSNGFKDILASYAPLAAGGGSGEEIANDTALGQAMRRAGFNIPKTFAAPLYHGALPFTEGPIYLGAVIWALFIFGLFAARRSMAIWLGLGTLLIFLLSAGKNLEGLNRFLYDTLPQLNKFRAPSSALSVCTFLMLLLGVLGIHNWLKTRADEPAKARQQLLYAGIAAAVGGALVAVVLPGFLSFSAATDAGTLQRFTGGQIDVSPLLNALEDTRAALYRADAWRSFLFVGLTFGALFALFRGWLSPLTASLAVAVLLVADFGGVNGRYVAKDDWTKQTRASQPFSPSPADQQILQDPDPHYRVMNLTVSTFQDPSTSYFHKSIGGYSAVKMRRYQDLIDGYLAERDLDVLNMLNTRYFIVPGQDGTPQAQQNPAAFGPAWLVSNIQMVNSNDAEFAALGTVEDLKNTAIVHQDFSAAVAGLQPSGQGTISLTKYSPQELDYRFQSDQEQLVVFSEIWYGPDLGWEATIDGQPADLIRTNYLLRGLRVPAGQHEIKMVFRPASYFTGTTISLLSSLLIILGIAAYAAYAYLNKDKVHNTATPTEAM
ncbi:YfhO family protein [Neolewinella lacunae]|uniref:YfhO family protein n=1 Tax=Neolewinella lacunae TaxID=1517758 RepID=A0A923PRZ8_9BACT|nr:YfhO family protein [Neolewinella lacunae]MBC6996676.1 YfhO family protein [Neolewinella lacunae]MDN3634759.1 YfhO family protein [Neolewinella lacunae]